MLLSLDFISAWRRITLLGVKDEIRAPRNRTLTLSASEKPALARQLLRAPLPTGVAALTDRVVWGDFIELMPQLPKSFVDLLILDPPYNLNKRFGAESFSEISL